MRRQQRGPMFKNRIVGHGEEKPDQLLANPGNWRIHPDDQRNELEKVLETVGWVQRIIVNRRTGRVVDGHLRVDLAMRRDEESVPVTYVDLSEEEERLVLLTYDPLSALAGRDPDKLPELLETVKLDALNEEIDLDLVLKREVRDPTKGLSHDVKACSCCANNCRPGCGCWREEDHPEPQRYPKRNAPRHVKKGA
jgi:hypothetical protein